ncbi:alpha/beta fold hydrolase [Dactylosporangium sp. AC04546]|uniref:alpha/beta fold hydrolase n=1 Tax=Dactylosporangium sp. AC04546 TaxID=2862460 RepID=UPI001EE08F44|nr:alpha/beta fold hydrolase [Dactylosporangium sp. AC04546]WVK80507.1 alpha/beta fold hydrolase [Dactylosporangium sp. AC04546]
MDPRFVGRSTPLDCDWPVGTWSRAGGPDRESFQRTAVFEADLARRCAARQGGLLPYATTRNTARDIDAIRAALAEPTLSYFGYSYGTYLGAVYAQMFPTRAGRMVLDSAVDPSRYGPSLLRETGRANEAALHDWAAWTAGRHAEYGLGATETAVLSTLDGILAAAERRPVQVGAFRVDPATVRFLLFNGVADDRDGPNADLAASVRVLDSAVRTGSAEPTPSLAEVLAFVLTGAESATGSVQAAILCGDVPASRNPAVYREDIRAAMVQEPRFAPQTRNLGPCAFWPTGPREQPTRIGNTTPALIVHAAARLTVIRPRFQAEPAPIVHPTDPLTDASTRHAEENSDLVLCYDQRWSTLEKRCRFIDDFHFMKTGRRPVDAAVEFGVSTQTASRWHRTWQADGRDALAGAARPGRTPRLSDEQLSVMERRCWMDRRPTGTAPTCGLWPGSRR